MACPPSMNGAPEGSLFLPQLTQTLAALAATHPPAYFAYSPENSRRGHHGCFEAMKKTWVWNSVSLLYPHNLHHTKRAVDVGCEFSAPLKTVSGCHVLDGIVLGRRERLLAAHCHIAEYLNGPLPVLHFFLHFCWFC